MTSAFSATVSHFALKIDFLQALQIWQFSEAELKRIEGPGALFMEKYAPVLDGYGLELEFAAAILPILSGKIFAIIAAKRALEAKRIPQPTDRPAKPATVTEIRPAVAPDSAQPATEQTHQQSEAASTARAESPGAPPSAFTHAAVDSSAELVTM